MADSLIERTLLHRKRDPIKGTMFGDDEHQNDHPYHDHELDNESNEKLHSRLMEYYKNEMDRQYENRVQQGIDEDFYDNIQWTDEDASVLKERGQSPIVFNVISQSINWILGTEKRGRIDFKVLPRKARDAKQAERKTDLIKYLSDVNHAAFERSSAFEDAVKVGVGWLEDAVQDESEGDPIYSRRESWRNMLWDSASSDMDMGDCRFISRSRLVDLDWACAMFPDRKDVIEQSVDSIQAGTDEDSDELMTSRDESLGPAFDSDRRRVRLIEMWFKVPVTVPKIVSGEFVGQLYDPEDPEHVEAVSGEYATVADKVDMQMHVAVMTSKGLIYKERSPYKHNKFPFTPIWCYRRGRDGLPYGVIRGMRDLQEDINKRASKALYIMSSNKVVMDEGAVDDLEEFREENARPDGILIKRQGKAMELNVDRGLERSHLDLMSRDISMIQQASGVTDELLGMSTNAQSGKAVQARQSQGMMSTSKLFDNMRYATQIQGAKQLSLIEQYYSEEKVFRITDMRGNPDFISINDGLPENDIIHTKADFVISEEEWRATIRQSQSEQLMEMISRMPPQVSMSIMDLIVEGMDVPNRDEIVKRIRQITGQSDPDADPNSPEEQQRRQQQQKQAMIQEQMVEAELRKKMADAGKSEVEAKKKAAEILKKKSDIINQRVGMQSDAIDAATNVFDNPSVSAIADSLLRESGFIGEPEREAMEQEQMQEQQRMQEQQAMEQQAMEQQQAQQQGALPNQQEL